MTTYAVVAQKHLENTSDFTHISSSRETNVPRLANLIIQPQGDHFSLYIQSTQEEFPVETPWMADLPITPEQLWGAVRSCQRAWHEHLVYYTENDQKLFQRYWDLAQRPEPKQGVLGRLAVAGANLFDQIFFPDVGLTKTDQYKRLYEIGHALRAMSQRASGCLKITSDVFFAPWNLVYSAPLEDRLKGSDATWDGFWGSRHVVEHAPLEGTSVRFSAGLPLKLSLQLDENIDRELGVDCNGVVKDLLEEYRPEGIQTETRNTSQLLADALRVERLTDQLLYFCCHAQAENGEGQALFDESSIALTDRNQILTTQTLSAILGIRRFENAPLVFLNACETGRMNSLFYQGFARVFLDRGASGVIGTQTEIPAVFAGMFARRFLEEFFRGGKDESGTPRNRAGDVLLRLRKEFLDTHHNPLGLLYSMYRGYDAYLPEQVPRNDVG